MDDKQINSYRDLKVWQGAIALTEDSYRLCRKLPKDETYGLSSQIRRAATSIAANIAEGHGRESTGAFIQHLRIAQGSLKELETHLIVCVRVGLLNEADIASAFQQCESIGKMARALIRSLQNKIAGS